jgi:hypothetical protein
MREKQKLEVTFDFQEALDFMEWIWSGRPLESKKKLQTFFEVAQENANITVMASIGIVLKDKDIDTADFMMGMNNGIVLALALSRPNESGSIREFLNEYKSKNKNVSDISEAFRKRKEMQS